jgi:transcriptional regulator with XRE-family HTH domain
MIADRIKELRTARNLTQAALAKKLGITRNAVNSWEQGFSLPSLTYLVELAKFFNVATDYILEISDTTSISTKGLAADEIALITSLIEKLKSKK